MGKIEGLKSERSQRSSCKIGKIDIGENHKCRKKSGRIAKPISGRVHRASATETVDSGLIPGWVKPKTR